MAEQSKSGGRSRWTAKKVKLDGLWFGSKLEASRYSQLKILEKTGKIARLKVQPRFPLHCGMVRLGEFRADFSYIDLEADKKFVVEDVKGKPGDTPLYRWKRRHFEAEYKTPLTEVRGV